MKRRKQTLTDEQRATALRIMAIATAFASTDAAAPMFVEWARRGHMERGQCTDPNCFFKASPDQWRAQLVLAAKAAQAILREQE